MFYYNILQEEREVKGNLGGKTLVRGAELWYTSSGKRREGDAAGYCGGKLQHHLGCRAKVSAEAERSADEYLVLLYDLLRVNGVDRERLTGCIMASVVPSLTGLVEEAVTRLTALRVIQVGPGTKTGFRIRIDDPTELGADLAADTAGAIAVYGVPLLIIDAGTVTTIAAVDKSRTYLGGCILPGLYASAALP